ncbi:unnamed protein product [Musa hybrid cultivar]
MQDPDPARVHGPWLPRWPAPPARSSPGLPPSKEECPPRHQTYQPPHRLRPPGQDRRLRRQPNPRTDNNGPLRLLRRYGTIACMSPERIDTDLNHKAYDGYAGNIWSFGLRILSWEL